MTVAPLPGQTGGTPGTATASPVRHSLFVRVMLCVDLVLCLVNALNAAAMIHLLPTLPADSFDAVRVRVDIPVAVVIALFGTIGNVLLLRHRRAGFVFAGMSLLAVVAGLVHVAVSLQQLVNGASCPPDTILAGILLGMLMRVMVNGLYVLTLAMAGTALPRGSSR